jgi:hypothetical protein
MLPEWLSALELSRPAGREASLRFWRDDDKRSHVRLLDKDGPVTADTTPNFESSEAADIRGVFEDVRSEAAQPR